MVVHDQFIVFSYLEFHEATFSGFGVQTELFSVCILHLKYTLVAMTTKICILPKKKKKKIKITWTVTL